MRELVVKYLSHSISRRGFVSGLTKAGLTATAAQSVLSAVTSVSYAQGAGPTPAARAPAAAAAPAAPAAASAAPAVAGVKVFQGHGGAGFAEQLIASGVKYVFGNSASEDAQFYEALVIGRSSSTSSRRTRAPAPRWPPATSRPRASPRS